MPIEPDGAPKPWQRRLQRLAMVRWVTTVFAPIVGLADPALLRMSRDRYSLTSLALGLPVRLISTTGARTGRSRSQPLTTVPNGNGFALIGSNFGRRRSPGWCHNLRAEPAIRVRLAGIWRPFRAREVAGAEREALWTEAVALYPGYARYALEAAPRQVPVFFLTPVEHPSRDEPLRIA